MQHAQLVGSRETCAQLAGDLHGLVFGKMADAPHQRGQILSIHVLHGEVVLAARLADVIHPAHVGVRDLSSDLHFVQEAHDTIRVVGQSSW